MDEDFLKIVIEDNGIGMDEPTLAKISDPFMTSRTSRKVGLGIPFFKAAAEACEGTFNIQSDPGHGTLVEAIFKHSHIDRMPLGDIVSTLLTLIIGTSNVHWIFEYRKNQNLFIFDDAPIKETLGEVSLSEPAVMKFIREYLEEGMVEVHQFEPQVE